jgi:RND superfamily putative drug exporter
VTRVAVRLVVGLRFLLIPLWIAAAILAAERLPALGGVHSSPLGGLVPGSAPAVGVEKREFREFGSVLSSRVAVVQRRASGFHNGEEQRVFARALRIDRHQLPLYRHIVFALPITNARGVFPSSRERDTTAITFLYYASGTSLNAQLALADSYSNLIASRGDALVGVTGVLPARSSEWKEIRHWLRWVTLATIALIALVLLLVYRSPAPAVLALGAAGIVYVIATHLLEWFAERRGTSIPQEVEPVMIALLLGLVTDYSVFFISGTRRRLEAGDSPRAAVETTAEHNLPIVLTAGLIVAAGVFTLVAGTLPVFRAFGPGLAITVLICLAVALTFVPAALVLLGRFAFWPRRIARDPDAEDVGKVARLRAGKPVSFVLAVIAAAGLCIAASWGRDTALGFTLIRGQPPGSQVKRAAEAAAQGFAPGIVSPTTLVLSGRGLNASSAYAKLAAFERLVGRKPGVAGVVGPAEQPRLRAIPHVFVTKNGTAARLGVILSDEPLGARAVRTLRNLRDAAPALLRQSGLSGVRVDFAGDTALATQTIDDVRHDVFRVAAAVLLANFLLLAIFLRALIAPLYLVAASTLALAASIGLTTLVFQHLLGHQDLTYYVPFAASVLLLSLGSDYNLFVVGRIAQETEKRPLREAVAFAAPRAARTVTTAGVILAGTFALLALIPIRPMRELAFVMAIGILLDTFLVRSLLVPSLVSLFGVRRARRPVPAEAEGD